MTNAKLPILDQLRVASPCDAAWSDMTGDDRQRFCGACKKNVYNLTVMTPDELVALIERTEGQFCGRLYKRHDQTVMTEDCPEGWARILRKAKRRTYRTVAAAVTLVASLVGGGLWFQRFQERHMVMGEMMPSISIKEPINGKIAIDEPELIMGDIEIVEEPAPEPITGQIIMIDDVEVEP